MRYQVTLGCDSGRALAAPIAVDVAEAPGGGLEVLVDGRRVEIDVVDVGREPGRQVSVRVAGKVIDLATEGSLPDLHVVTNAHRARAHVESERWRSAARVRAPRSAGSSGVVRSPMPGRVVKVLVSIGDAVQAGQGVAVLEAMKMENEVCAAAAGAVVAIHVVAGTAVEGGAKLITLT